MSPVHPSRKTTADEPVEIVIGVYRVCPNCQAKMLDPNPGDDFTCPECSVLIEWDRSKK